jgi:delta-aminolevulinic acid dehydratase/porphobilinogen synthase
MKKYVAYSKKYSSALFADFRATVFQVYETKEEAQRACDDINKQEGYDYAVELATDEDIKLFNEYSEK